jgi:putative sterol carrier protein
MALAFSDEWARAWGAALNASELYRSVAADWEGSIVAIAKDGENGASSVAVYLDPWHGHCREARQAAPTDLEGADFVIEATPRAWRELLDGRIAPLMALMTGRIRLARGDFGKLLPHAGSAKELVALAGSVPTEFPQGW